MSAKSEWEAKSEQEQMRMLTACIFRAAKERGVRMDAPELVGDTWLRVVEHLDEDKPLAVIVMRAAQMAMQKQLRHERRDASEVREVKGADSESIPAVNLLIDAGRDSVEDKTITKLDFSAFLAGLDSVNMDIVNGLIAGFSAREIAPTVGMTHTAVNKRVARMRAALAPCIG